MRFQLVVWRPWTKDLPLLYAIDMQSRTGFSAVAFSLKLWLAEGCEARCIVSRGVQQQSTGLTSREA